MIVDLSVKEQRKRETRTERGHLRILASYLVVKHGHALNEMSIKVMYSCPLLVKIHMMCTHQPTSNE